MDHILYRKQNFRNIKLDQDTIGETVGVVLKNESLKFMRWAGFIRRETAKADYRAKPVLLAISRIDGEDLQDGEYVQGCMIGANVYVVVDSKVSVVRKNKHSTNKQCERL